MSGPFTVPRSSGLSKPFRGVQLGLFVLARALAQDRGQSDAAEQRCHKALTILQELGNRSDTATSYHQLDVLAQERGQWDAAEQWYHKSLTIDQELGNRSGTAISYHQLGMLAQEREQWDSAEQRYHKALTIEEELGNRPDMALTYAQLDLLACERGNLPLALEQAVRCVCLFEQIPHPATGTGPRDLRTLTAELGVGALEQAWRDVTGTTVPPAVHAYVTTPASPQRPGDTGE